MVLEYVLYYGVLLCWAFNIYFLALFALEWQEREPEKLRAWLSMAAIAALALGLTFFLPARGGYDNNHDFLCLGQEFFTSRPGIMLMFKEVSPLFTDALADFASGRSLFAILWKNRVLPVLSIFVFFTGLRRLGAGITVSAAAAAFFFLNFLSLLNASSFSTTSSNILIWLISLLAIFDAYASSGPGPAGTAWITASLVLVISARIEFLPVNLLLLSALVAVKAVKKNWFFIKAANMAIIAPGVLLAGAWTFHALNPNPANQVGGNIHPLFNLLYQLGARNLGTITGSAPQLQGLHKLIAHTIPPACYALCAALFLLALSGIAAGCLADRKSWKRRLGTLVLLSVWIGYFSVIFQPLDFYPLHFMRHQLYFFLPFAYLLAAGLDGFGRAAGARWKGLFTALCVLAAAHYCVLNARAALGFNRELRTNDIELDFLMKARREWPDRTLAVHPIRNRSNSRADLIHKYFPSMPDCDRDGSRPLLKYVSPEPLIFRDSGTGPLEQAPLLAGRPDSAWKALSFRHAFYTVFFGRVTEIEEPVPVTIGFFRLENSGRDKAFMETMAGACAFDSGNYREAEMKFSQAAAADPGCLNCKYFLAIAYAAQKKRTEAGAELLKIEKLHGSKLPGKHRALVEELARGETGSAARLAREISSENPELFFRKDFPRSILEAGRLVRGRGPGSPDSR